MTPQPPQDPLVALWQTTPKPDTSHLMQDLQRQTRLHQQLSRTVLAIVCGIGVLLAFEEWTGRVQSRGILTAIWTLGLAVGLICRRRTRHNRSDALTLDTVSLLKSMIARAKNDLFVARCLYAGVPCGAVIGYIVTKLVRIKASPPANGISSQLSTIQAAAGIAALLIMVLAGALLARSRRAHVQALTEKLKSISDEV